jgi:hypothetical protein
VKEGRKEGSGGMEKLIVENFDKFLQYERGEGLVITQSGNLGIRPLQVKGNTRKINTNFLIH